jgi:choline dehydrogenase-like flavoprotein
MSGLQLLPSYDVLVVGAGLIGSSAARHLTRMKHSDGRQLTVCLVGPEEPTVGITLLACFFCFVFVLHRSILFSNSILKRQWRLWRATNALLTKTVLMQYSSLF